MKINECLLNSQNNNYVNGKTIGEILKSKGIEHLWEKRPDNVSIDTLVIHYTSAADVKPGLWDDLWSILEIFCMYEVSSHYIIDRKGFVYLLVPDEEKAWHCGGSIMPEPDSRESVNSFSIGVELIAFHDSGFTDAQYVSLEELCGMMEKKYGRLKYVGHETVGGERAFKKGLRDNIKIDPGPKFDWDRVSCIKKGKYYI